MSIRNARYLYRITRSNNHELPKGKILATVSAAGNPWRPEWYNNTRGRFEEQFSATYLGRIKKGTRAEQVIAAQKLIGKLPVQDKPNAWSFLLYPDSYCEEGTEIVKTYHCKYQEVAERRLEKWLRSKPKRKDLYLDYEIAVGGSEFVEVKKDGLLKEYL